MPGHGRRKAATKLTGVLVAVVLCVLLLAVLFIGGRLWWVSFYGSEAPPPARAEGGARQPAASAEPSGPDTAGHAVSAPETSVPVQASATRDTSARQPALSTATASIRLAWDRADDKSVTGYKILYGTEPGIHPESLNVGNQTTATLTGLQRATRYYIVAVSVDAQGNQSRPSNEVEVLTAQ